LLAAEPTICVAEPGVPARKLESPKKVAVTAVQAGDRFVKA